MWRHPLGGPGFPRLVAPLAIKVRVVSDMLAEPRFHTACDRCGVRTWCIGLSEAVTLSSGTAASVNSNDVDSTVGESEQHGASSVSGCY